MGGKKINAMKDIIEQWGARIGPWIVSHGLSILLILVGAYILHYLSRKFIEKLVRVAIVPDPNTSADSERKREDTLIRIFTWTIRIVIMVVAVMMVLQETGIPIGPMLAGAGILGLAVGFGGQYLIRDIITGFFMILENQYRIGDAVQFDNTSGVVEDISLRITTLRDLNGTVHHIPHGEIKRVSNLSKNFSRINLNIGVTYDSNLDEVIRIINQTGQDMAQDERWKASIIKPPQFLRVDDFTDTSIVVKILGETLPSKQWEVTGELRKRLKYAFDNAGIEMPFAQKIIHHISGTPNKPPET
jgi:small conductance mechanosensitive channel